MRPSLASNGYGVALVGEALGQDEWKRGEPFVGAAGFRLTRLIEWAGYDRSLFDIWNTVWCRPPNNRLEGESYESGAILHCRGNHWGHLLNRVNVIVPMGNVPLAAFTGRKGILKTRGYVRPGPGSTHLIPTVHPSFIQRGQSKYSAAFINDLQRAVELARGGIPIQVTNYVLDPLPAVAYDWACLYARRVEEATRSGKPAPRLAYDIETPGKGDDESDTDTDIDPTYTIWRIGFSFEPFGALSIPWTPGYMAAIRLLLESDGEKVVWNAGFDNPRINHHGVRINGLIHDGMVAWHILHSDLPKGLGFVATFTCPYQPEWKHLSGSQPAFYNATDADVELRSFLAIESELRQAGLWDVYERDVLALEPLLVHMNRVGMPINHETRLDRAIKLDEEQKSVLKQIESAVPIAARRYSPKGGFAKTPADTTDLITIRVTGPVRRCERCGLPNPTKPHFRTLKRPTEKRPQNPCAGATVLIRDEEFDRYARLDAFKPSRDQLIRYQQALDRIVPMVKDKKSGQMKPSFDEKALKTLIKRYPLDTLYPLVLRYRDLDKLAGTYVGRPL